MEKNPLRCFPPRVIQASETTCMVQSVTLHKYGKPERIKVEETPLNKRIPDYHVQIEVYYCGLSYTDHYLRLGIVQCEAFPVIMGSECCGFVTGVGYGVRRIREMQWVLCLHMQGGLFRHVVHVPEDCCFSVPLCISPRTAVSLGLNFVLAYLCLFQFGYPGRTKTLFMDSIGGSVGTAVIKLARSIGGVKMFGTASESKHEKLLSLGVNRVYRHEDDYVNGVLEACPRGVDLVINCAGGSKIHLQLKMLKPCGRLITIGSNSSAIYPKRRWRKVRATWDNKLLTMAEVIKNNYTVAGINVGRLLKVYPERIRFVVNKLFDMHVRGIITPPCIHSTLPFEKAADGLMQLCERENVGKVLLAVIEKTDLLDVVTIPRFLRYPKLEDEDEEGKQVNEEGKDVIEEGKQVNEDEEQQVDGDGEVKKMGMGQMMIKMKNMIISLGEMLIEFNKMMDDVKNPMDDEDLDETAELRRIEYKRPTS